jgi:hypothetical protein
MMMGRYAEVRPLLEELTKDAAVNAGHRLRAHLSMMNIAIGLGD